MHILSRILFLNTNCPLKYILVHNILTKLTTIHRSILLRITKLFYKIGKLTNFWSIFFTESMYVLWKKFPNFFLFLIELFNSQKNYFKSIVSNSRQNACQLVWRQYVQSPLIFDCDSDLTFNLTHNRLQLLYRCGYWS